MGRTERVLVTGGAGYIGSWVTRFLLEAGYEVVVLDRLLFGGKSLEGVLGHPRFQFVHGDVRDEKALAAAIDGADRVVHLAALVGEAACKKNPDESRAVNVTGTRNVATAAIESGVKQLVFFSTASSYGVQDISVLADETSQLNPVSLYAESKIESEGILAKTFDGQKSYYSVFRPSTVHGPSARMRFDLIVNHLTRDAYLDHKVEIFGGSLWRPLIWVGDAARCVVSALQANADAVRNQAFNLGNHGGNFRKIQVAEILREKLIPDLQIVQQHDDPDLRSYRVDFSKIEKVMGFKVVKPIEAAMADIIQMLELKVVDDPYDHKYRND